MSSEPEKRAPAETEIDAASGSHALEGENELTDTKGHGHFDAAADFLRLHAAEYGDITEQEIKNVLWKIDLRMMPLMLKIVISNAALYGMTTDLGLAGTLYSWTGSIFYFGYLVSLSSEYPSNILIQKFPVGKVLGISCIIWSALVTLMGATYSAPPMMVLRFLMGVFEAPIFPCCSVITVMWYKKKEQPLRTAIWFSGFSSLITGIVSYGLGNTNTSVASWRLLFIVLGGFTFLWSIFITIFLPDSPVRNKFLNEREKYIAVLRIKENMTGTENREIKWYQIKEALTDWKTWPLLIFTICINVPNGGLVTFAAQIVSGLGYSKLTTTLLGMPTGLFMTFGAWMVAIPAYFLRNCRCLLAGISVLVPLVCCVLMMKLDRADKNGLLAAYYCFYFYWASYPTVIALTYANTAGHTKKTTVNALMFIGYCVANIIAPQFFISTEAPGYKTGYNAILGFLVVAIFMLAIYAVGIQWEINKQAKREAELRAAGVDIEAEREAEMMLDTTDREKKFFTYIY
ncbi:MFS general substrate transporter [Thozetella sp. PMI_491]|nr:MFS general substrate transporter [Thozetella sp. PMI_491]